jgi:hypothetical protein
VRCEAAERRRVAEREAGDPLLQHAVDERLRVVELLRVTDTSACCRRANSSSRHAASP